MLSQSHPLSSLSAATTDWSRLSSTIKCNAKLSVYKNRLDFQTENGTKRRILRHISNSTPHDQIKQVDSAEKGLKTVDGHHSTLSYSDKSKEKIKKMFEKVEYSVSSYDTAWVAMVPSQSSPDTPCFPECLDWLLENQLSDGSWGLPHHHDSLFVKDALSSTLACVLALRRWGVGEGQINKGLHFIKSNFALSVDERQHSPVGFDIIFPGMIEYAKDMNFSLDLESDALEGMLHWRALKIKRLQSSSKERKKAYLAYVSEGIGKFQDWEMVMKHQKKDGSLFNSPATTAAALIHLKDPPGCLSYLRSVVKVFGNSVPTIYPLDIHSRLCMVDTLVKLGTDRHFTKEIEMVLNTTYRLWQQKGEEIFSDITTCATAYRILLLNGYGVSPDPLIHFFKDGCMDTFSGNMDYMNAALEVYKALELVLNIDETPKTEKLYLCCRRFLKDKLFVSSHTKKFRLEVDDALQYPHYVNLERLRTRRYIEQQYDRDGTRLQKTAYRFSNISNDDFLKLAVEDFNMCQLSQRQELKDLDRWFVENKLDQIYARIKMSHFYFNAAATLFQPELKDCRLSWTKISALITFIDDIFDAGGSEKEILKLVELMNKWDDVDLHTDFCSDQARIMFSALQSTISDIGDMATACQARNVTSHIVQTMLSILSLKRLHGIQIRWCRQWMSISQMDVYLLQMAPILIPCCYFLGVKLSEKVITSTGFHDILMSTCICTRLLNDCQSYERESKEGKLINVVSLSMIHSNGVISKEKAMEEIRSLAKGNRKELFRLVFTNQEKDIVAVPRACKDLFWTMCRIVYHFYWKDDGFAADAFVNFENEMWNEPIELNLN